MKLTGENRRPREKTYSSATLSITNPTWTDPGSKPGLRGGRPVTNRLSHGTASSSPLLLSEYTVLSWFCFGMATQCHQSKVRNIIRCGRMWSEEWLQKWHKQPVGAPPRLVNRDHLKLLAKLFPGLITGEPEFCLLSEKRNPFRNNPQ
jgi:hypothetical protein